MVLAFELGPDCAGQCTAGAWYFSHHDISLPAQSFASDVPSARNVLPHTPPSQCLCLKSASLWASSPSLTASSPAKGDPSVVRDFFSALPPHQPCSP